MLKMKRFRKCLNFLAVIAIAIGGISNSALADTNVQESAQTIQPLPALVGQCRAAKISTPVFRGALATSEALQLVAADKTVTLAGNTSDANGFIAVSSPTSGYVFAVNLKLCNNTPPPTDNALCRRVIRPNEGLTIRRDATSTSSAVGGVPIFGRVTLTTSPATVTRAENRDWVQISAPANGWVSNGLANQSASNLGYCP